MQSQNKSDTAVRWAVVTGASSGIGREIAISLARNHWQIIAQGRDELRLKQVRDEIQNFGGICNAIVADMSDSSGVKEFAQQVKYQTSSISLLVNNAGWGSALSLEETDNITWERTIASCLTSTVYCCREFLPMMKASSPSLIINNASIAARRGFPNFTAYSAAKGGVDAFSRALREELLPFHIGVTTLIIGATDTPFWTNVEGDWDPNRMMNSKSIGQFIASIAELDPRTVLEECVIMPAGGAL